MARSAKQPPNFLVRAFRSAVAKLKKLGLVSKGVDARSQRPTRYMKGLVKRFAPVLQGESVAVKVPKKQAKKFVGALDVKGDRVIVPKRTADEKITFNKKTGELNSTRTERGQEITGRRKHIVITSPEDLQRFEKVGSVRFGIPLGHGEYRYFDRIYGDYHYDGLANFLEAGYNYTNWWLYVIIETTDGEEVIQEPQYTYTPKKKQKRKRKVNKTGRN